MAQDRTHVEEAWPGDIIGIHNHGTIKIGDTFTEKEPLKFTGIPNFAPEHFRRVRVRSAIGAKHLKKGLAQLAEEGAVQLFRPLLGNESILGAVGVLQFDVTLARLKAEYNVDVVDESVRFRHRPLGGLPRPGAAGSLPEGEPGESRARRRGEPGLPGGQRMAAGVRHGEVAGDRFS